MIFNAFREATILIETSLFCL